MHPQAESCFPKAKHCRGVFVLSQVTDILEVYLSRSVQKWIERGSVTERITCICIHMYICLYIMIHIHIYIYNMIDI